ncbi:MAG: hypothetical protein PHI66_04240 [Candidatus Pacebacteria bacterium]|nr:hypothetical protein [Candidatus Paceibacterota bacterium]
MIKNSMAEDLREARKKSGDLPEDGDALGFGNALAESDKPAENENKIVLKTEDSLVNFKKPEISPIAPDSGKEIFDAEKTKNKIDGATGDKPGETPEKKKEQDVIAQKNLKNLQKLEGGRSGSKKILIIVIALIVLGLLGYIAYVAGIDRPGDKEIAQKAEETVDVGEKEITDENADEEVLDDMIMRDEMRKDNLRIIFDAIDSSYDETAGFPYSGVYAKLNGEGDVYEKIKESVMLAGFNEDEAVELMRDPQDPDFYFAYKSLTPNRFELTTRLENQEDGDCDDEILENEGICIFRGVLEKNVEIYQEDVVLEEEIQDEEMMEEDNTGGSEYSEGMADPDPMVPEE